MYALVDCNNFYASCERVFNPSLRNKPIAILSNNDGCVIARSDEAKKLNLPMGAPIFKYEHFCKRHNIAILSSNYPLYGDMSARVMNILEQFAPRVEVYSIDEAFIDLTGFDLCNFDEYGTSIRKRILKWTGLPICIGIAPTKALCKVANKIARKFPRETKGVYVIDSEAKRLKALKWTPVRKIWGIGHRLERQLLAKGCKTAFEFTQVSDQWVQSSFSITEWKLKKDLEGIPMIGFEIKEKKRSIAITRSFEESYSDIENITERISTFAGVCAEKLRAQKTSCHMIIVTLKSDRYKEKIRQYKTSKTIFSPYPTDSTLNITRASIEAVKTIFKTGVNYKKGGVIVTGLVPTDNHQLNLFFHENPKHKPLMSAMDHLNKKFKSRIVKLASQDLQRTWKMKQERLSPRYTTRINEIIIVK